MEKTDDNTGHLQMIILSLFYSFLKKLQVQAEDLSEDYKIIQAQA